MPKKSESVYGQVVSISRVYLGPAADRFVSRQIENHLHIQPHELTKSDLKMLIDWLGIVVSMLTNDKEIVEEYTNELKKLSSKKSRAKRL